MQHFRSLFDTSPADIRRILAVARLLKTRLEKGDRPDVLPRTTIALLFEKPSLRTRVSFQAGMTQLGGSSMFLGDDVGWKKRESPADFTRVLGQFVDAVICRAKSHAAVETLASFDAVPVINGLTDLCHPCQALADVMTIEDAFGSYVGKHLVFVGDGNNVAHSLALICAALGMPFTLARPDGYDMDADWIERVKATYPSATIRSVEDPREAVRTADAIYTDVWASMGQESEAAQRRRDFAAYQVNETLLADAPPHARVLHCLPAIRGEEITNAVADGPNSDLITQAGNRMHAQKGLLVWMLNRGWVDANLSSNE